MSDSYDVLYPTMTETPLQGDILDRLYPTDAASSSPAAESETVPEGDHAQAEKQPEGEKPEQSSEPTEGTAEYAELKAPGGFDNAALGDFKSFAKEQGLSPEQAQKALDFAGPKLKAMIEAPYKAWQGQQTKWEGQVRAYYGQNLETRLETARLVFQAGDKNPFIKSGAEATALKRALIQTGAGNHPAVVKLFVKAGEWISARQGPQDKLLGSMYPSMKE